MYTVTIHRDKRKKWRWNLSYNKNILAVSTNDYETRSHAKRSFTQIYNNLFKGGISIRYKE